MRCIRDRLFTVDGMVEDEGVIRKQLLDAISGCVTSGLSKRVSSLLESVKLQAYAPPLPLQTDRIHVANGCYSLDGTFSEEKVFCNNRLTMNYRPDAPTPERWLQFLSELLEPDDIPTLQEFMGYTLLPTTKGQKILCGHSDALSVATVTLVVRTGFSASSIKRARDSLRDKGYLVYQSRGSNRAALYALRSVVHPGPQDEPQDGPRRGPQDEPRDEPRDGLFYTTTTTNNTVVCNKSAHPGPQDEPQDGPRRGPRGTWLDDDEADRLAAGINEVLNEMQRIGMPGAQSDYDRANTLVADYSAEWVTEALYRTGLREEKARNWRFVEGILRKWREKGGVDPREKPREATESKVKFANLGG